MNAKKEDGMNAGESPTNSVTDIGCPEALRQAMIGQVGPVATARTVSFNLPAAAAGKSVLILGAGIAGLTAAYELSKQGYRCTVLEAQDRVGGRNRSARRGDTLREIDDSGKPVVTHRCDFDDGLYLNLGPGRIPYHHRRVIKYCTDFKVKLEPYIMETTANLISLSKGETRTLWRNGQVANDTRGYLAATLAERFVGDDEFMKNLRKLLDAFGDLDGGIYDGSTRSGSDPTIGELFPHRAKPLTFDDLVESKFWDNRFYQPTDYLWQPTLFQPVGGMDKIVDGFKARVGKFVKLNAEVLNITLRERAVEVTYKRPNRSREYLSADYCLSSIPLPILRGVNLGSFSDDFKQALAAIEFERSCKVGWQANKRFWEDDSNQIFGGISWTDHNITQVWYPSNDYFSRRGTMTGAYNYDDNAETLGRMSPTKRLEFAREGATQMHPEFGVDSIVPLAKGVSIAWHKVPYQLGGWAAWSPTNPDHPQAYNQLLQGEAYARGAPARFYVIGDQVSPLTGWMEGCMMSVQYVSGRISKIIRPVTMSDVVKVPNSFALTRGRA